MITISADEYKKRYGDQSLTQLKAMSPQGQQQEKTAGFLDRVKQTVNNAGRQAVDIVQGTTLTDKGLEPNQYAAQSIPRRATALTATAFNAVPQVATAALPGPARKGVEAVSKGFEGVTKWAGENAGKNPFGGSPAITDNSQFQKFAGSKAGKITEDIAGTAVNTGEIANDILIADQGAKLAQKGVNYLKPSPGPVAPPASGGLVETANNVKGDVLGAADRYVNHNVTQALGLTAGDVKNISLSTGNEVGKFVADNNLIRDNLEQTKGAVKDFFDQNYNTVRNEIGGVSKVYKPSQVPRYVESLKALQEKVGNTLGLQAESVKIENLLNKKDITLTDVQQVKELIDKHIDLYKATGDVREGIVKQGFDTIRKDIRSFIEQEVKDNTGADIRDLNNKVATSQGILKAVEARSTSGLTKSMIGTGDFGAFISGTVATGNPFVGLAAVFVKKLLQSPSIQLKIAKFFDGLSDARKAAVIDDLKSGSVPPEFNQFIKTKNGSKGYEGPGAMNKDYSVKVNNYQDSPTMKTSDLISHEGAPDPIQVGHYRDRIKAGDLIEPIKVIKEGDKYGIEDGKHRFEAYKKEGITDIPVEVIKKPSQYTKGKGGRFTGSK